MLKLQQDLLKFFELPSPCPVFLGDLMRVQPKVMTPWFLQFDVADPEAMPKALRSSAPTKDSREADSDPLLSSPPAPTKPSSWPFCFYTTLILLALALTACVFSILIVVRPVWFHPPSFSEATQKTAMVPTVVTAELKALGEQWTALRQIKGHWQGGEFNKDGGYL